FRSYPDPFIYGWHQGGRPSAVHVFALTLARVRVNFDFAPDKFGHVWTAPEVPDYTATLTNNTLLPVQGKVIVSTRSYDRTESTTQEKSFDLKKNETRRLKFSVPVKLNGYHDITATLQTAKEKWSEKRSFVRLAPDTRAARWTPGKGSLFGYW